MSEIVIPILNREGKRVGGQKLSPIVFGVKAKPEVLHEAVLSQLANQRKPAAHTKTRGEVRGGGKKPWRQKGTGRARHGSSRSPIWVGGGITFGPRRERNFSVKINKKKKNLAIRMALSDKAESGKLILLDELTLSEYKTKVLSALLRALPVQAKKTLIVMPASDEKVEMSGRNIPGVFTINANSLSLLDVLAAGVMITTSAGVERLEKIFAPKK
jgi:large subunit ribosomal protein L4